MRYLKLSQTSRNRVELWLSEAGGRGNRELLFGGYRVSGLQDEEFLEICGITR